MCLVVVLARHGTRVISFNSLHQPSEIGFAFHRLEMGKARPEELGARVTQLVCGRESGAA